MNAPTITIRYVTTSTAPILYIQGELPHYRRPLGEIKLLRAAIASALKERGLKLPLTHEIELHVYPKRGASPDLVNIVMAVTQALDSVTLGDDAPLKSDSQISAIVAEWLE